MEVLRQKQLGAYYTPEEVVRTLVRWAVAKTTDRMLDPSCGDGRFLTVHPNSVGVEGDPQAAAIVHERVPGALLHQGDFFAWALQTHERFECAAGNPPFIRYQRFAGEVRQAALKVAARQGVSFSSLSSSWAPFLVATASLLKPGGRMAFVVPAEIGHAPYAEPLLNYLVSHFGRVQILAVRDKLFTELSEDCWLLYCDNFGRTTDAIQLNPVDRFRPSSAPPRQGQQIGLAALRQWGTRLRPFLLPVDVLDLYRSLAESAATSRLGELARVGIGYVTGANEFFHLRPSAARLWGIPTRYLVPAVRNGRDLSGDRIDETTISGWRRNDEPNFLLRIPATSELPLALHDYLESHAGRLARETYKCRNREPWYVVPDVHVPDAFLSYMSNTTPALVANSAGCVATNSVHVIRLKTGTRLAMLQRFWGDPLTQLSSELEGHPLGGGMLKLEPREAGRVVVCRERSTAPEAAEILREGVELMRRWRHHG